LVSLLQVFLTKLCMHFSSFPWVLHALPIYSSLIWSTSYLARSTNYECYYVVLSTLPSLPVRPTYSPQDPVFKSPNLYTVIHNITVHLRETPTY
jgi:hypothetical protein